MRAVVKSKGLSSSFGLVILLVTSINTSHFCLSLTPQIKTTLKPSQTLKHQSFRIHHPSSKDVRKRAEHIALMSSAPVVRIFLTPGGKHNYI